MRRMLGASVALVAVALVVMTQASASQLPLAGGPRPFTTSIARCDDAVDATTPPTSGTSTSVQVSGIAAERAGAALSVTVYDPSTWATSTGTTTVPATGGSLSVAVSPAYTPSASAWVSVTIGTWRIPATWAYAVPSTTTGCVVIIPAGNPRAASRAR